MLTHTPGVLGALEWLSGSPECGLKDLDTAHVLRPGALTLVDVGASTDILYAWMADVAVMGRAALVADGSNFLDVYRLATAARRRAAARLPDATHAELTAQEELVLDRVRVARGFTAHQIHAIVEDLLPQEIAQSPTAGGTTRSAGGVGLIVAPGLLDMYLDDELSREESKALATRALSTLRRLAVRLRAPAVVSNRTLPPASDHPLRVLLDEAVDEHVILKTAPRGGLAIHLPRRGAMFLSPGAGRTRLEDFLEPDERATRIEPIPTRAPGEWRSNGNRMYGKFGEAHRRSGWAVHEAREAA